MPTVDAIICHAEEMYNSGNITKHIINAQIENRRLRGELENAELFTSSKCIIVTPTWVFTSTGQIFTYSTNNHTFFPEILSLTIVWCASTCFTTCHKSPHYAMTSISILELKSHTSILYYRSLVLRLHDVYSIITLTRTLHTYSTM